MSIFSNLKEGIKGFGEFLTASGDYKNKSQKTSFKSDFLAGIDVVKDKFKANTFLPTPVPQPTPSTPSKVGLSATTPFSLQPTPQVKPQTLGTTTTQTPTAPVTPVAPQIDQGQIKSQIGGIQTNIQDLQAQQLAMTKYGVKDTNDLIKDQSGSYVPKSPEVPTDPVSPETTAAVTAAEKALSDSMKLSEEEITTQEDIDNLIESTKLGYQKIKGQAIPMEFVTGQLKSLEERALGLAEPLENKLARLQAARQSSTDASKFALDRADKEAGIERDLSLRKEDKATEAERYDKELTLEEQKIEEDKRRYDLEYQLSQDKFEEDKRQFGLEYAQNEREIAQKTSEATVAQDTKSLEALNNYSLVNEILPAAGKISGLWQMGLIPFTEGAGISTKYDQLKSLLQLDSRQKLKGQGTISDYEGKVLAKAATNLNRAKQSQADFIQTLKDIRGVFANASGMDASVSVIDPQTGESDNGYLSREEIADAVKSGYTIIYQ